jgi:SAM-dependent methyltransferase
LPSGKEAVQKFWNEQPCGAALAGGAAPGTPEFFQRTQLARFQNEPFIREFARFEQWRGKKVLEVGCGIGVDHSMFARHGAQIVGIDLTPVGAAITAQRLAYYGVAPRVLVGDSESLPFPDAAFDLVYSWGVIHHTPNTPKAASELLRVVRPGGSVVAMIYNRRSLVALQAYIVYGLLRGRASAPVSELIANHLESPGTKAYTVREARALFAGLNNLRSTSLVTPYDLRIGRHRALPRWLGTLVPRQLGYFLVIEGTKPERTSGPSPGLARE